MIVTSHLVDNIDDIHPQMRKEVGLRFANLALADTYKKSGLMIKGKVPTEFYIAGDDQKFVPASAKIDGNTVVVWNKHIKNRFAVRFGFSNVGIPTLFSNEGYPEKSFSYR